MLQVDPVQSYLHLKIGPNPGTKSGVFRNVLFERILILSIGIDLVEIYTFVHFVH